ncbi:GNAT family N-acetyltransferase [Palleronia sp.]|uniref:GNAT family N-acetyltransferase n=1 Tax=Palleronia sp. TaxID=1940284 RepID=UPI0035C832BA
MEIREIRDGEHPAMHTVVEAAFDRAREAELIDRLHADGAVLCDLVAVEGGRIVGQTTLSRMVHPGRWACLAPLSVHPNHQRRGIGGRLAEAAAWFEGAEAVVVLGDPAFYSRHGFLPAPKGLTSPFPVSHTLVAGRGAVTALEYPAAFS